MRPVLWGLLICIFCLPLAFVLYLVGAAKYPPMDAFTMKLPSFVRTTVAGLTLQKAGYGKGSEEGIDRTIRLDPENAEAWGRRCHFVAGKTKYDQAACRKAIALDPSPWNYNGLGLAQENAKDFCAAEDSYTTAIRRAQNDAPLLRNMARAALRCGHTGASVAGFEVAESLDAKAAVAPDPDDEDEAKTELLADREYLAVAYNRTNQQAKAATICAKAHPGWKTCHCELTDSSVKCSDEAAVSASKK
jgi:tetratricopeptide (TPR) repeat protein